MTQSNRVPAALQPKFDAIALAALCRKRPSPLLKGQETSWAAGAVHALGLANFLFDATQTPHCKATDIWAHFGLASSTGQTHSKKIRDAIDIGQMDPHWTLPSRMDANPLIWMLEVNGLLVDVRRLPLEVQDIAYAKGLIPYVPARKAEQP
jgi:hypothetical protein